MNHVMKSIKIFTGALLLLLLTEGCSGPLPITANPDDHTTTSGTLGSAKHTNQLPPKPDNQPIPQNVDPVVDSLLQRRDTVPY